MRHRKSIPVRLVSMSYHECEIFLDGISMARQPALQDPDSDYLRYLLQLEKRIQRHLDALYKEAAKAVVREFINNAS